jgi:hypothetical protein
MDVRNVHQLSILFERIQQRDRPQKKLLRLILDNDTRWLLSDKSSHLRCWRLRSADQLPTGLVLSGAPGPYLQEQAASRLKLHRATYNNKGIDKSTTNNISNTSIVLSKIVIILFRIH